MIHLRHLTLLPPYLFRLLFDPHPEDESSNFPRNVDKLLQDTFEGNICSDNQENDSMSGDRKHCPRSVSLIP